jgi:hypothetical protein
MEGGSRVALYTASLSPSGDWLVIRRLRGGVSLYRL